MSTIKSSAENLTLNADGANNDIKFQSNGSEVASIDQAGVMTGTTFAVGTIGKVGNTANDVNIYSTGAGHNGLRMHVNGILPTDNAGTIVDADADLGDPSYRFKTLYLSGGVAVGGTAAANTLDDYEEGSWTPTANGNLTLSASGRYTKIGNQVIARANIDYTGGTFDGTSLTISGLPFTSSTNAATRSVGAIMANQVNVDTGTYALISYITTGVTTLKCYQSVDNGGWDSLLHSNLSTDSHMYITTTYEI